MNQPNCPFIGLHKDPDSYVSFASMGNTCFRAEKPFLIRMEHQENCCLTDQFRTCPVYLAKGEIHPPAELVQPNLYRRVRQLRLLKILAALLVVAAVAGLIYFFKLHPQNRTAAAPSYNEASVPTYNAPSFFITPQPTDPYQPGAISNQGYFALTRTPEPTPQDTPFPDSRNRVGVLGALVVHQILEGESLDYLATEYNTTVEAIRMINLNLKVPLWVGEMIVLPQDIMDTSLLPTFETAFIPERSTLKSIAQAYQVELKLLKQYNSRIVISSQGQDIILGEQWVLLPRPKETESNP